MKAMRCSWRVAAPKSAETILFFPGVAYPLRSCFGLVPRKGWVIILPLSQFYPLSTIEFAPRTFPHVPMSCLLAPRTGAYDTRIS
jgi:hypothetical protein